MKIEHREHAGEEGHDSETSTRAAEMRYSPWYTFIMNATQLVSFIRVQLATGMSKEDIRDLLKKNNWQDADIDSAFSAVENPTVPQPSAVRSEVVPPPPSQSAQTAVPPQGTMTGNSSGMGALSVVPEEIRGWSWGGFLLTWIWGLGNGTYIALLALIPIPFIGFIMAIILGIKGREWAWRNKRWQSVDHFKRVQRTWTIVGVIVLCIILAIIGVLVALVLKTSVTLQQSRTKALDSMREVAIKSVAISLEMYASDHNGAYPQALSDLAGAPTTIPSTYIDPATKAPYSYQASADGTSYTLCATLDSAPAPGTVTPGSSATFANGQYCIHSSSRK